MFFGEKIQIYFFFFLKIKISALFFKHLEKMVFDL